MYNQEEYTTLVNILHDNYQPLIDHPIQPLHPSSSEVVFRRALGEEPKEEQNDSVQQKRRLLRYYRKQIRYYLSNAAEEAADYTETLLQEPKFVELYSGFASELGLKIISDDSLENFPQKDVAHRYLRTQLKTEDSLLHRDLRQSTSLDGLYRYKLKEENRLIYALFSDFERAERLDVYKPVGDKTQELIREQRREDFDRYNDRRLTDTQEQEEYILRDPIFVGIQFFDLMVKEAFYQEVEWHVWLSYYESFTRNICKNYEVTRYSEPTAEWPNDYSRLLYEMNQNLLDWIEMVEDELKPDVDSGPNGPPFVLDVSPADEDTSTESSSTEQSKSDHSDSEPSGNDSQQDPAEVGDHIQIDRISTDRGQRNIPEMAVIVLFSNHEEILTSNKIPMQFMAYLTESIFLSLLNLRKYDEGSTQWKYSQLMLHCLEENISGKRVDPSYQENLKQIYDGEYGDRYDYGVRHEIVVKDTGTTDLLDKLDDLIHNTSETTK